MPLWGGSHSIGRGPGLHDTDPGAQRSGLLSMFNKRGTVCATMCSSFRRAFLHGVPEDTRTLILDNVDLSRIELDGAPMPRIGSIWMTSPTVRFGRSPVSATRWGTALIQIDVFPSCGILTWCFAIVLTSWLFQIIPTRFRSYVNLANVRGPTRRPIPYASSPLVPRVIPLTLVHSHMAVLWTTTTCFQRTFTTSAGWQLYSTVLTVSFSVAISISPAFTP